MEAHTVAKVLMDQHFDICGLPEQLNSDNGKEVVKNQWRELFSEFKIQHITTPPYNPPSNPVEGFRRTLITMLRTMGEGIQDNLDLFVYNTTVSSSTGVTPHYAIFGREAILPVDLVFPTPSAE